MTNIQSLDAMELRPVVGELYKKFGLWAIIRALVATSLKRRRDRMAVNDLPNSILRDIGLPEREDHSILTPSKYWPPRH